MNRLLFCILSIWILNAIHSEIIAQDKSVRKIIEIGQTDNRSMQHEDFLSNIIGGRPVGSHALEDAEKWVAKQFRSWGLEVKMQEVGEVKVGFSRGPWFGKMLNEGGMDLHFDTPSYTAGTKGPQRGHVVLEPKTKLDFAKIKGKLKGAWVLLEGSTSGAINGYAKGDSTRQAIIAYNDTIDMKNAEIIKYNREHKDAPKTLLKKKECIAMFYKEMKEAGVLGFIQSAKEPIQALSDRANFKEMTMETLPTVCDIKLEAHQFDIIKEKVTARREVILEFDIRNHFFEGPVKYHNVIGILKGSKYPNEYVLAGGHLDAYDSATGAVDDAQGVSVTMEAARILAAANVKPKRSIMFTIWTGEECGLLGSKYFVENKTVPWDKISNYFNRDQGPLVATNVIVPEAMYEDFVNIAKPLEKLNPEFPFTVNKRIEAPGPRPTSGGSSDYAYFQRKGIPTISLRLEDTKGYGFVYRDIWHTDKDLYNMVYPDYINHSTIVTAVMLYGVANLDHMLDRKDLYSD